MKKILICALSITILLFLFTGTHGQKSQLAVNIIDVGQGDSSLIISPSGKSILIDGGQDPCYRPVLNTIRKNRLNHIDYMIATHSDDDHIGSLDKIMKKIPTKNLYMPGENSNKEDFVEFVNEANKKSKKIHKLKSGMTTNIDKDTKIFVLSPQTISPNTNDNSLVLLIKYKKQYLLFMGDASSEIEDSIINSYKLPKCAFLKVGHHGSKNSTSDNFLKQINADVASISCGYMNRHGHPHKDTLRRLKSHNCIVYRTDINGSMTFYFNGNKIYTKKNYKKQ